MAEVQHVILKRKIDGVIYELLPKTVTSMVFNGEGESLEQILASLADLYANKAEFEALQTRFNTLTNDAPELFDTLKEIGDWIESHEDLYQALVGNLNDKVDKEEGKGLSEEDFTTVLKEKLEALYTQTELEAELSKLSEAITNLTGNDDTEGSLSATINEAIDGLKEELSTQYMPLLQVEEKTITEEGGSETVIPANAVVDNVLTVADDGSAKDSGYKIGGRGIADDDTYVEAEAAKTLATQKDVKDYADSKVNSKTSVVTCESEDMPAVEDMSENTLYLEFMS